MTLAVGLAAASSLLAESTAFLRGDSNGDGDAELRICRRGASFRLYKRAIGAADWTLAMTYIRSDLPAALQVGPVI